MNDNMIENDPRLSAWLLDEMTASEQQDFEKILDADPSARAAADALRAFAEAVDVITYEFENIATSALDLLGALRPIHPGRRALAIRQRVPTAW